MLPCHNKTQIIPNSISPIFSSTMNNDKSLKYQSTSVIQTPEILKVSSPDNFESTIKEFANILQSYSLVDRMQILTELLKDLGNKF